jgi:hypothetical protein
VVGASCGASCTMRPFLSRWPWRGALLRRCAMPAPIAQRSRRRSLALPAPARRGYRCRLSTPVVRGTPVVPVRPCRFLRAAPPWRDGMACWAVVQPCPAPPARALLSENRSRRLSARRSAVKTAEGACERSEVLTARGRRALQSHAVFRRNAPQKTQIPPERPISPVRPGWLRTRELSRAQRESERVRRVKA